MAKQRLNGGCGNWLLRAFERCWGAQQTNVLLKKGETMPETHPIERLMYSPSEVRRNATIIYEAVLRESSSIHSGNFERISSMDLELLFKQYDAQVFAGALHALLQNANVAQIHFRPSGRMTRAGGHTKRIIVNTAQGKRVYLEIAIAADMLYQSFNEDHRPITVSGLVCTDRLQAMQRIFEHELIHLAELLLWERSSCKKRRFHMLAGRIFGHKEFTHRLITRMERAKTVHGVRVGDRVSFMWEGGRYTGIVNRITKRATVLVEDEQGEPYKDGKRYLKFYVPVHWLE